METKKRALGRGLEQLFNTENLDLDSFEKSVYEDATSEDIIEIDIDELRPNPYQPRKKFDEEALKELSASIKEHGIFQPILVKKSIKGYNIIAGERRVRASKLAGLQKVPAIVRDFTDEQMMEIGLLENLQRENLNVIEEAKAYQSMIETLHLTQDNLALKVGKSRSHITNILGLLNLPENIQNMVFLNQLTMGHARVLSKLEDLEKLNTLANKVVAEGLTVRDLENLVNKEEIEKRVKIQRRAKEENPDFRYVESLLRDKLDTKIKVKDKKIEISFTNVADLNRILEVLNVKE